MASTRVYLNRVQDSGLTAPGYVFWLSANLPDPGFNQAPTPVGTFSNHRIHASWVTSEKIRVLNVPTAPQVIRPEDGLIINDNALGIIDLSQPDFFPNKVITIQSRANVTQVLPNGFQINGVNLAGSWLIRDGNFVTLQSDGLFGWRIISDNRETSTRLASLDLRFFDGTARITSSTFDMAEGVVPGWAYTLMSTGPTVTLTDGGGRTFEGSSTLTLLPNDTVTLQLDDSAAQWNIIAVS